MKTYVKTYFAGLRRALFESCSEANTINESEGNAIAARYSLTVDDMRADFAQANEYGQKTIDREFCACSAEDNARLTAEHLGRYNSARSLFASYCSQASYESCCESREAARNEDRAYGSD